MAGTQPMSGFDTLIERMEDIEGHLIAEHDQRRFFHSTYLRTTRAVKDDVAEGGFVDAEWAERWDLAFAQLYLDAFEAWENGDDTPGPWSVAFEASKDQDIEPLRHVLLGMNAHVNYDLPQALLAVITDDEFDNEVIVERRSTDHAHVDSILVQRIPEEDKNLAKVEKPGSRSVIDRLMLPLNRAGTKRLLKEGRAKVWNNARALSSARRLGPSVYGDQLSALEELSKERVTDLLAPRYVLVHLAWRGFGVELPPQAPSAG